MMKYTFETHNNDYCLIESQDLFGCTGVSIWENGIYLGMVDTVSESDFSYLEHMIKVDRDFLSIETVNC